MGDYYKILDISKDASQDEIKKAYRRLALQWHPDKNPKNLEEANKKFKQIAEAYEVLGNCDRRQSYDHSRCRGKSYHTHDYSSSEMDDGVQFFAHNFRSPEEIFQEFFGTDNPFSNFFEQALNLNPFFGFHSLNSGGSSHYGTPNFSFNSWEIPEGCSMFNHTFTSGHQRESTVASSSTSTSTRFVNGKKITTKKKIENGVESITVYEDDVEKRKT